MCMQINPASEICCPENDLVCFRFIGRVMGKALFDKELVHGHMVKHLYKHILGFPVMLRDLQDIDVMHFNSLKKLEKCRADLEDLCLDFTLTEEMMGMKKIVQILPKGNDTLLDSDNLPEYLEACLKYRLLGRCNKQLKELLLGFYDVIPEPLLLPVDFQLELLMCGLPEIDVDDWRQHTVYSGGFERYGTKHQVCAWFWDIVS
ncbi:hypothetical protein ACHAWF_001582 [Thalassiosira exigua]